MTIDDECVLPLNAGVRVRIHSDRNFSFEVVGQLHRMTACVNG